MLLPLSLTAQIDLQKPFSDAHVHGSITLLDQKHDRWIFSDSLDAHLASLPASTFKIINSCIPLEKGMIKDEHEKLPWDGQIRAIATWNADTDLATAFENSTVWFYVALAKKIGKEQYLDYLTKCHYGNGIIDAHKDGDFWNYGNFGIFPIGQIKFLKAFYEGKLPFSKKTYRMVKRIMLSEQTADYTMRGKTGWTQAGGKDIGWYVGYVQRKKNVYFFATRLTKDMDESDALDWNFLNARKDIIKTVLKQMKAIE